jgi:6,7-dimethyl-8-ribityllumazine synthase
MPEIKGSPVGKGKRYAIVASRYNDFVTGKLVSGAKEYFAEHGVADENVDVIWCPGALEVPAVVARASKTRQYAGIVAIGCVIRGETDHYQFVSENAVGGVAQVALKANVAIGNAILTVESAQQAIERAGEKAMNKGWEAAAAAMEVANLFEQMPAPARWNREKRPEAPEIDF